MNTNIENLQYPIGKFDKPMEFNDEMIQDWIRDIKALPFLMDACIENMDAYQLQTPYRDGGWTVAQLIHHVADSHLNAYTRFKLALTEDNPTIKPYNQKGWAEMIDSKTVPVNISVTLIHTLHTRLIAIMENMQTTDWLKTYVHPEYKIIVPLWEVLALYAWHGKHHAQHIFNLKERMNW